MKESRLTQSAIHLACCLWYASFQSERERECERDRELESETECVCVCMCESVLTLQKAEHVV